MTTPRLDRLSALLQGLDPGFEVVTPDQCDSGAPQAGAAHELLLFLLTAGEVSIEAQGRADAAVFGPALIVCRPDRPCVSAAHSGAVSKSLLCIRASFAGPVAPLLLSEFGAPLVISLGDADGALSQVAHLIASEIAEPRCGQPALLERAGDILFIGLLRHLVAHPQTEGGLFNGLADARIARALVAMHAEPQRPWKLETLAEEAGMSRTVFATRFRDIMQCPPGAYLGRLRLSIARRAMASGSGLKRAASASGYASPATLSRALGRAGASTSGAAAESRGSEDSRGKADSLRSRYAGARKSGVGMR